MASCGFGAEISVSPQGHPHVPLLGLLTLLFLFLLLRAVSLQSLQGNCHTLCFLHGAGRGMRHLRTQTCAAKRAGKVSPPTVTPRCHTVLFLDLRKQERHFLLYTMHSQQPNVCSWEVQARSQEGKWVQASWALALQAKLEIQIFCQSPYF